MNVDGKDKNLPANTLVIWEQSHRVLYGTPGSEWSISWLQFHGEEATRLLKDNKTPLNIPVTFNNERIIDHYLMPIFEDSCEYIKPDVEVILNFIRGILLEINRKLRNGQGNGSSNERKIPMDFQKIRHFLDINYSRKITLDELAEKAHLASIYLSRKFKEYFGIAPIDYVITLRLNAATLYLQNPDLSIQEIAELVGYKDSFHFSKLFKRHMGISPQAFRNSSKIPVKKPYSIQKLIRTK
jgi:AraC-like DNA-binding protein